MAKVMGKVKCPVKETEIDVPRECSLDCMYLDEGGTCVHPLMNWEESSGCSSCL